MTKENIYKAFLEDPLLLEKKLITQDKINKLKLIDPTGVRVLEIIKMAISGLDTDSEGVAVRKITQYLNK